MIFAWVNAEGGLCCACRQTVAWRRMPFGLSRQKVFSCVQACPSVARRSMPIQTASNLLSGGLIKLIAIPVRQRIEEKLSHRVGIRSSAIAGEATDAAGPPERSCRKRKPRPKARLDLAGRCMIVFGPVFCPPAVSLRSDARLQSKVTTGISTPSGRLMAVMRATLNSGSLKTSCHCP